MDEHAFGLWTIICKDEEKTKKDKRLTYICRCKCGFEQSVSLHDLKSGRSRGCRKCTFSGSKNPAFVDKTGLIINEWQIIGLDHIDKQSYWLCKNYITGKITVKSDNNIQVMKSRLNKRIKNIQVATNDKSNCKYLDYVLNYNAEDYKPKKIVKKAFTFVDKDKET